MFISLIIFTLICLSTHLMIAWYGHASIKANIPFAYTRLCLIACLSLGLGFLFVSLVTDQHSFEMLSFPRILIFVFVTLFSMALALFAPLLILFGIAKKKSRRITMIFALPLALVSLLSFGIFYAIFGLLLLEY